jgi:predicted nucleic acid-binding protein
MADGLVVDASALVDLLLGGPLGKALIMRLGGQPLHAPAHIDVEVLSVLDRLATAGALGGPAVNELLGQLRDAPLERHPVQPLLRAAWAKRAELGLGDALYVELAASLGLPLITTDARLRDCGPADVVVAASW